MTTTGQPLWRTISEGWDPAIIRELDGKAEVESVATGIDLESAKNKVYFEHQRSLGNARSNAILG